MIDPRPGRAAINIKLDADVKKRVMKVLEANGMTLFGAVSVMAKRDISEQRIPFEVTREPEIAGYGMSDEEAADLGIVKDGTDGRNGEHGRAIIKMREAGCHHLPNHKAPSLLLNLSKHLTQMGILRHQAPRQRQHDERNYADNDLQKQSLHGHPPEAIEEHPASTHCYAHQQTATRKGKRVLEIPCKRQFLPHKNNLRNQHAELSCNGRNRRTRRRKHRNQN